MSDTIILLPDRVTGFPSLDHALKQPDGLLAIGGNLEVDTLVMAYQKGIFPWFNEGDPILWWSPSPRMVLKPGELKLSRSLRKLLRKNFYQVTFDYDFSAVIAACASTHRDSEGTWITHAMIDAYTALNDAGHAHSIEVWQEDSLVGGLYGVALGRIFFAESMFSKKSNTSKIAMAALSEQLSVWQFQLIDCQVYSDHLDSLGAKLISRTRFLDYLERYCSQTPSCANWKQVWQWNDL
ncbi:leucyl/phenylalanyl-tRNA--protein transferase [Endozoicomonas sp. SCSIO W0465]|uniref:leucyl/phenylalanyl-tRNA--protein transferase n=1 Tax=Endozoicomonas sp. SCSIO W0465 TaxID=2918516 RepID=UPI00207557E2|nr:leucyl/phenylalanyl-tRNA--protein transferase [Endozoicomonas sp. SCSIO W0465]USE33764.1 leucyl/phenylalanyl-tRNA--protein transferase [Endozoicomonas sp. SCSIO W0465]